MTLADLVADRSLPDASVRLGVYIALNDDGEGIELRFTDISGILFGFPGKDKIRGALRPLETLGYISRKAGGAGHGDVFRWTADPIEWVQSRSLRVEPHPIGGGFYPYPTAPAPPYTPPSSSTYLPPPPLDARTREVVESEKLAGCRGALRDYLLLDRMNDHDRRYFYAQSVVSLIEGGDEATWADLTGAKVAVGRAVIIGDCLNQLAQCDEVGPYFKRPPGDIANLKSKVRYQVRKQEGARRDARRHQAARDPGTSGGAPPRTRRVHIG